MIPVPDRLLAFIQEGRKFLIAGHKEPDGDCLGSQIALGSALARLGKEVILCSAGPFKRTEVLSWQDRFVSRLSPEEREGARVIILDCGSPDRTGDLEPFLKDLPLAVIDHHAASSGEFLEGTVIYLDEKAPSTTFLVLPVIQALGLSVTPEEAEALFFGLCTDTGFFRHVGASGAEAFLCAAALTSAGANPKQAWQTMNGGKSLGSRQLMGLVLSRVESHYGGKLLASWEEYEETRTLGAEGRDSDALYQMLMSVGGVEAAVIVRQEKPGQCALGFRSRESLDVARIARNFGGGGHKNAAGASVPGNIRELLPRIIESFREIL